MSNKKGVCIIGAGPSGMSALYHFAKMKDVPEVVCYEKQSTWSGLWNYTWKTGTDEYGEPCHGSMYHNLWINSPKETLEFHDYTLDRHFGKAIPSYLPRTFLREYMEGRWTSCEKDLKELIQFNTAVKRVEYNEETDDFTVRVKYLKEDRETMETFTHVIVAVGIFSFPNLPDFTGLDAFPGAIIHAHSFRDAREYKGKKLLVVGSSYSAEDVALQCMKYGADHVICTWQTNPMAYTFPDGIEQRPLLQKVEGNKVFFKDGSTAEVDAIILCTGYLYSYPFLPDNLRLKSTPSFYPNNLYKGTVFMNGGNKKVLYLGAQAQYFTFPMFDIQAAWACKYIAGDIKAPPKAKMETDIAKWTSRLLTLKDTYEEIDFQADFIEDLGKSTEYNEAAHTMRALFHEWAKNKYECLATYRDQTYVSIFTGTKASQMKASWVKILDESIE